MWLNSLMLAVLLMPVPLVLWLAWISAPMEEPAETLQWITACWPSVAVAVAWGYGFPYLSAWLYRLGHRGRQLLFLEEDAITTGSANRSARLGWGLFSRVVETDRIFVLLAGDRSVFLPKRALSDAAEVEAVRAMVQERLRPAPAA